MAIGSYWACPISAMTIDFEQANLIATCGFSGVFTLLGEFLGNSGFRGKIQAEFIGCSVG